MRSPTAAPNPVEPSTAEYWEHRLQENWGLHGVGHISYGAAYNHWLYKVRRRIFKRELRNVPIDWKRANVLDIGSGTGFWIDAWRAVGVNSIIGSDLTRTSVEHLRDAHPDLQIVQLDISASLPGQSVNRTYDVVSAFDVLFHIVDDSDYQAALKNIARLLRPGGVFLFSDNFLHCPGRKASHQSSRTLPEITRAIENAGLCAVRRVPMFVLMNTPIDTTREWLLLLWRAAMYPVHLLPLLGHVYGAVLFPVEICATRLLKESLTTEMMICRKPEQ
jgi:SAM-dependent methyltransferase